MLVPRLAGVLQSAVDEPFGPLLQVGDLRVGNAIWEFAHVMLQRSVHELEAANQQLRMMIVGEDEKSPVGASGWVDDEVGKGFMEGSNGVIDILLENEKRVDRRQKGEYVLSVKPQDCSDCGQTERIRGEGHSAKYRADFFVSLRIVVTESLSKN